VGLITSALANPDARARREALLSLAKLGDEDAGELVGGLLEDADAEVRMAAVIAVGQLKVERALRSLISMLEGSKDPDECLLLVRALGQLGDPGAVASIEKHAVRSLFSKPRTDVRIASYRALNAIGTPHARRLLNQAVSDKDDEVKTAVKEMLHMR
jgi:HEAT repeat protein